MSRLHVYTVHINPSLPQPYESARFVEEGFSWWGFIFSGLWLLYHRLWLPAVGVILANALLWNMVEQKMLSHAGYVMLHLSIHLLVGFSATDWLRSSLKKRGYITSDIVTGDSLVRAEQRFFDRYFASHHSAAI